jgi:hypothetical protein
MKVVKIYMHNGKTYEFKETTKRRILLDSFYEDLEYKHKVVVMSVDKQTGNYKVVFETKYKKILKYCILNINKELK